MSRRPRAPGPDLAYSGEPRTARLGASEVAAVLGLSPWQTAFSVWARKSGLPAEPETGVTRRGRYLERGVLAWLRDDTGALRMVEAGGYDTPWVVRADGRWPHVGCHPDGYLLHAGPAAPAVTWWSGAEAKTARRSDGWGDGPAEIPAHYWVQCQVGIALTGLAAWDLGVLYTVEERFAHYHLDPDDTVAHELLDRAESWWTAHVVADVPPDLDASEDARRWLLSRYPAPRAPLRSADATEAALAVEVARLRAALRAAEAAEREASARLQAAIGDAGGFAWDGGRATWSARKGGPAWREEAEARLSTLALVTTILSETDHPRASDARAMLDHHRDTPARQPDGRALRVIADTEEIP